jgi:hypothetical protein
METDAPRTLSLPSERNARIKGLDQRHMAPLKNYVQELQNKHKGKDIPHFDPKDGGINARVLFVQEAPGPKAVKSRGGSGFVSRNNDDQTAANFFQMTRRQVSNGLTAFHGISFHGTLAMTTEFVIRKPRTLRKDSLTFWTSLGSWGQ